jgi:ATP-dependent DNA helicase RecG
MCCAVTEDAEDLPAYEPVYHLTANLTQKTMARAIASALHANAESAPSGSIPPCWRAKAGRVGRAQLSDGACPDRRKAIWPPTIRRVPGWPTTNCLAHQLTMALGARLAPPHAAGVVTAGTGTCAARFWPLPYRPTAAQDRAVAEIAADMARPQRMSRLLQGDVGSGKTLVAFLALLIAVEAGGQGVLMAPTEILARQHYEGLRPLAAGAGVEDATADRPRQGRRACGEAGGAGAGRDRNSCRHPRGVSKGRGVRRPAPGGD